MKLSDQLYKIYDEMAFAIIEAKELENENDNLKEQVDALQSAIEEAQSND